MKKSNKLGYITIVMILSFITGIATPAYAVATKDVAKQLSAYFMSGGKAISLCVNGTEITNDSNGKAATPFTSDGVTYVPVRAASEALGKDVTWDAATATVKITDRATSTPVMTTTTTKTIIHDAVEQLTVYFTAVGKDITLSVDGTKVTKDSNGKAVTPFTSDGVTYVPVRAVAEALGKDVTWDATTATVKIADKTSSTPAAEPAPVNKDINKVVTTKNDKGWLVDTLTNYEFVLDKEAIGTWEQIEYVGTPDQFDGTNTTRNERIPIRIRNFYDDGREVDYAVKDTFIAELKQDKNIDITKIGLPWTKGYIDNNNVQTVSAYEIRQINGKTFMFIQHKSGDYTIRGKEPAYFVLLKTSDTPDPEFAPKVTRNITIDPTAKSFKMEDGTVVNLPGTGKDESGKFTTIVDDKGERHDKLNGEFELDKDAVGEWELFFIGDIPTISKYFDPNSAPWSTSQNWKGLSIYDDGTMIMRYIDNGHVVDRKNLHWTKGYFVRILFNREDVIPAYAISTINGKTFMLMQWKSNDYVTKGIITSYYVFVKNSSTPASKDTNVYAK